MDELFDQLLGADLIEDSHALSLIKESVSYSNKNPEQMQKDIDYLHGIIDKIPTLNVAQTSLLALILMRTVHDKWHKEMDKKKGYSC